MSGFVLLPDLSFLELRCHFIWHFDPRKLDVFNHAFRVVFR
jgi:hypothetical protein